MGEMQPGHDSGHGGGGPTWATYVAYYRLQFGSWAALADQLIARGQGHVEVPSDPQTVEKGLRRLANRARKSGGQYGRWMLRFFGNPPQISEWMKALGQYHSRLADLPTSVRLAQLHMWNRPPSAESREHTWLLVGLASVHQRLRQLPTCQNYLTAAQRHGARAGAAAQCEIDLLQARLYTDAGTRSKADANLDAVAMRLSELTHDDVSCYHARLVGQRAYHLNKPVAGPPRYEEAKALFDTINPTDAPAFVRYLRCAGLAFCVWKRGDTEKAAALAQEAAEHAADGGLVRFRIMAFNLLTRMLSGKTAEQYHVRATRLAKELEDPDMIERVLHRQP